MADTAAKRCTKCGIEKPFDLFGNQKAGKYGKCSICKECHKAARQSWVKENPQKASATRAKYRAAHKQQQQEARKRWNERNSQKLKMKQLAWQRKNSAELRDSYIRNQLKRFHGCTAEIANELIELKREHLLISRARKQLKEKANGK